MTAITTYFKKEQELKKMEAELNKLKDDETLKNAVAFKQEFDDLTKKYGLSKNDVLQIVAPDSFLVEEQKKARKPREEKVYQNKNTDEVIRTKGGNNKKLREWKEVYGNDIVEGWRIDSNAEKPVQAPVAPEQQKEDAKPQQKGNALKGHFAQKKANA